MVHLGVPPVSTSLPVSTSVSAVERPDARLTMHFGGDQLPQLVTHRLFVVVRERGTVLRSRAGLAEVPLAAPPYVLRAETTSQPITIPT